MPRVMGRMLMPTRGTSTISLLVMMALMRMSFDAERAESGFGGWL